MRSRFLIRTVPAVFCAATVLATAGPGLYGAERSASPLPLQSDRTSTYSEPVRKDSSTTTDARPENETWPCNPRSSLDREQDLLSCENGIWRIRPIRKGILWLDFYHRNEQKWYNSRNNLNLVVKKRGEQEWQDTELYHVRPQGEVLAEGSEVLHVRYHYAFPNGVKIHVDAAMRKASPYIAFRVGGDAGSADIDGFQWHITFGQAEAVDELHFDGLHIFTAQLPKPFPGDRLKVQHVEWHRDIKDRHFFFCGKATDRPDPNNPAFMTRVLGLKQHVYWKTPMRPQDSFAFEARSVPWQPDWGVPQATPWMEGLWFVRNETLLEDDELIYGITNVKEYLPREYWEQIQDQVQ